MDFMSLLTSENKVLNHSKNTYTTKKKFLPEHSNILLLACHLVLFERYFTQKTNSMFLRN